MRLPNKLSIKEIIINKKTLITLLFLAIHLFVCKAQENVNCYDIIKTEYHNTYDSLENIIKIDTIIYIRICAADESQENEMILRKKYY